MKRFLSIVLALALCMTVAAAYAEVKDVPLTGTVNQYGWEVPVNTLKLTYYSCDDDATNQAEEDARLENVDKVLKDEFNIEIQKLVYAQDSTERLNLMLASGDYPEVIVGLSDAMANTFIEQGRAIDLTPYLEAYGQDVLASYGEYINLLREDDGRLCKLSSAIGSTTDQMGADFTVRWDWFSETGLAVPQSFEEYYEVMKAMLEKHPTNDNGEKVYAFSAFTLKGGEFYRTPLLYMGFYSAPTGIYKLDEDGTIHYWVDTEEGLEVAKYINRFWREGMIDPDFQSKDYDQSVAFMSNSRVAGNIGTWWHNFTGGHQIWETTDENYTIDKHMRSITWKQTDADPNLITNNYIRSNRVIVTDKCTNPEDLVRYFNWQCSPMGVAFNSMGPAGEDMAWKINADGLVEVNQKYWYGDPDSNSFLWDDFESKECGGWNYPIANPAYTAINREANPAEGWADPVAKVNMWDLIPDYSKLAADKMSVGLQMYLLDAETSDSWVADLTAWNMTLTSEDEESIIKQDVDDTLLTDWCNCIMADTEEECIARYEAMVEDLHDLGLDKLVAAQQAVVSENMAKLDGSFWTK